MSSLEILCSTSKNTSTEREGRFHMITSKEGEEILDILEDKMECSNLIFSQRHRLRWWAARGVIAMEKFKAKEKVNFT